MSNGGYDTLDPMRVVPILLCCCLVADAGIARQTVLDQTSQRDVFLITIDTLRADHVHCYGYDRIRTPALDQLAKEGVRFAQAFTPSPITNSSHASILTGLLPSSHGVSDFGVPLAATHPTLAELLMKRGYRTAAFIGAVILDSKSLAPGLDRGFEFYDNFPEHTTTKSRWGRLERRGMEVERHAESWLNAHPTGPHFVWVHFYDPHDPYEPPPPYADIYKDRLYDGEIAYADSALGHFLAFLKKQGWYDAALIVVVGDHGEGLGEHHEDTHGIFLYDSTTHVPLLVKLPNRREAGKEVEAQVRTTDILPTILELLGLPIPEIKFIEAPKPELYDLRSDPGEVHNEYEPWNTDVRKLRETLAELNRLSPASENASPSAVSAETIDELHALGYLGPADAGSSTNVPEPSLLPDPKDMIEEQNLLHAAMMAIENDETARARSALEKVLQLDEKSAIALTQLGHLEISSGNYRKALEYLRRAHELRPTDAAAALDYGRALELNDDLAGARATLQASLKSNPNQFSARLLLGQIYFRSGDANAALEQFEEAALLQPENVEAKTSLAKVLLSQKKFTDVVELLEPVAESSSNNADVFESLAQAYTALGRLADAQKSESRAKALRKQQK